MNSGQVSPARRRGEFATPTSSTLDSDLVSLEEQVGKSSAALVPTSMT